MNGQLTLAMLLAWHHSAHPRLVDYMMHIRSALPRRCELPEDIYWQAQTLQLPDVCMCGTYHGLTLSGRIREQCSVCVGARLPIQHARKQILSRLEYIFGYEPETIQALIVNALAEVSNAK